MSWETAGFGGKVHPEENSLFSIHYFEEKVGPTAEKNGLLMKSELENSDRWFLNTHSLLKDYLLHNFI